MRSKLDEKNEGGKGRGQCKDEGTQREERRCSASLFI